MTLTDPGVYHIYLSETATDEPGSSRFYSAFSHREDVHMKPEHDTPFEAHTEDLRSLAVLVIRNNSQTFEVVEKEDRPVELVTMISWSPPYDIALRRAGRTIERTARLSPQEKDRFMSELREAHKVALDNGVDGLEKAVGYTL